MPPKTKPKPKRPWQEIAGDAQAYRNDTISDIEPPIPSSLPNRLPQNILGVSKQLLSLNDIQITEKQPEELLSLMATGDLTSTAVTRAFLRRAALAQRLTNCLTELLPSRALARAKFLDDYYQKHQRPMGPLHGLPISVKEHLGMKGLNLCAANVAWWSDSRSSVEHIASEDAYVLQILWRAGAVFHARTTEPQSTMHLETDSNLWGVTVNPYNTSLSAGGSSGGEGALIACGGSVLGIGTDIGGSIRSPAAHNHIYGLKPTSFRIPSTGWSDPAPAANPISSVIGPISSSLSALSLFMRTIIDAKPWLVEPALIPLPWTPVSISPTAERKLRIGVMWHDGVVTPHPPVTRALQMLAGRLAEMSNVEVVEWKPYLHDEAWAIISSLYYTDGGAADLAILAKSGEPMLPLTKWIIAENPCAKKLSVKELEYWLEEREEYRREYARVWNQTGQFDEASGQSENMVDVLLCPVAPGVAPKLDTAKYWGYTSQWNLLDYPAAAFPVCNVDKRVDTIAVEGEDAFTPMSEKDEENWDLYDPEIFDGMPVALQLVARRYEDEKLLAVLEYIKREVGLPFLQS